MQISKKGIDALVLREGSRSKAYRDTKGIWTIGVGHTGGVKEGDVMTNEEIAATLRNDLKVTEDGINKSVTVPLTQNQYDALVSFAFNVGVQAFSKSTLLKLINLKLFDLAVDQFDLWHKPPEITGRRNSEKDQFGQQDFNT